MQTAARNSGRRAEQLERYDSSLKTADAEEEREFDKLRDVYSILPRPPTYVNRKYKPITPRKAKSPNDPRNRSEELQKAVSEAAIFPGRDPITLEPIGGDGQRVHLVAWASKPPLVCSHGSFWFGIMLTM